MTIIGMKKFINKLKLKDLGMIEGKGMNCPHCEVKYEDKPQLMEIEVTKKENKK